MSAVPDQFGLYEYAGEGRCELLAAPLAPGQPGPQPDARPVLLYVHGWKPGSYKQPAPDSFSTDEAVYGGVEDVALPWTQAGYRVLCFLWIPFADERDVATAERKIWAADDRGAQRWRAGDGSYNTLEGATDIGSYLHEVYRRELRDASRVHLVGHSLGCQVVGRLLEILATPERASARAPERVTLLDPYFTNFAKCYLSGKWTGERTREAVRLAAEGGCAVELIKSSAVLSNPLSDTNDELQFYCAYFLLKPDFIKLAYGPRDAAVLADRHSYARYAYLGSKGGAESRKGAAVVGLAERGDADVRAMMGSEAHFVQSAGRDRWDPRHLAFEEREGPGTTLRPKAPLCYA